MLVFGLFAINVGIAAFSLDGWIMLVVLVVHLVAIGLYLVA